MRRPTSYGRYRHPCLGKKWQKFAPRQLLLRCSNKLPPCNDAISALPPSMAVERSVDNSHRHYSVLFRSPQDLFS